MTLGEAIARFDRKERRAVLRLCGGEQAATLDEGFANILARELSLEISALRGLPWYMDYHWNWLGGALSLFAGDGVPSSRPLAHADIYKNNQEDVDALIVTENTLIMIEAKWDGAFDWPQYTMKLERLQKIDELIQHTQHLRSVVDWYFFIAVRGNLPATRAKCCNLMMKYKLDKSRLKFLNLETLLLPPPELPLYAVTGLGKCKHPRVTVARGWQKGDWPEADGPGDREI